MVQLTVTADNINDAVDATLNGTLVQYPENTSASGASYILDQAVNVSPTTNSTNQVNMSRQKITYNSDFNMTSGGWLSTGLDVVDTLGVGTIDKIVGRYVQINPNGGNVTAILGLESAIGSVGVSTLIANYVAYYVPNLSGVANIANVQNFSSFVCDHYESSSRNAGKTLQSMNPLQGSSITQELAPVHGGVATGRYYLPYSATGGLSSSTLVAGLRYYVPFFVPERTTYTKIGLRVTTAIASSNMRLGIHHSEDGIPTTLIVDSGDLSTATAGAIEATINESLEAGFYWLTLQSDNAIDTNFILIGELLGLSGSTTDNGMEILPFAGPTGYGVLPATAVGVTYTTSGNAPAMWLRK